MHCALARRNPCLTGQALRCHRQQWAGSFPILHPSHRIDNVDHGVDNLVSETLIGWQQRPTLTRTWPACDLRLWCCRHEDDSSSVYAPYPNPHRMDGWDKRRWVDTCVSFFGVISLGSLYVTPNHHLVLLASAGESSPHFKSLIAIEGKCLPASSRLLRNIKFICKHLQL